MVGSEGRASLGRRAVIAVLLTIGFYGLGLLVALLLLAVPYLEWTLGHRITGRLAVACLVAAGIILWSLLPRRDRFVAPGPRLNAEQYPNLFERLTAMAKRVEEPMPAEVYLMPDVNAGVLQRGGFLGQGGRRVMVIGLPLLSALRVSEFEGVLLHEFGHYHGGDVRLGPWIYRTREGIERTIRNLRGHQLVQIPFLFYGRQFLKLTLAISRQQEYAADALAAHNVGRDAMIRGLEQTHRAALAFDAYWRDEYAPLLDAGLRAPFLAGFTAFMQQGRVSSALDRALAAEKDQPNANPFDSHPTLSDRIAALQRFPSGDGTPDGRPAVTLLGDPTEAEVAVIQSVTRGKSGSFRAIGWDDLAKGFVVPKAQETTRKFGSLVGTATIGDLPDQVEHAADLGRGMEASVGTTLANDEIRRRWAFAMLSDLMTASLAANRWSVDAPLGAPIALRSNDHVVEPYLTIAKLASKELAGDAWRAQAQVLGIAYLPLNSGGTLDPGGSDASAQEKLPPDNR